MDLAEATRRLVPVDVAPCSIIDEFSLTINIYRKEDYKIDHGGLIVGDDTADKLIVDLDGTGVYFVGQSSKRFVNTTLELTKRFCDEYLAYSHKYVAESQSDESKYTIEQNVAEITDVFARLDAPAMERDAAWFNFLDMIRTYPD